MGHSHVTVYPHGDVAWRFAWKPNGENKWRYVTRKKKVDIRATAENHLAEMTTGSLIWSSLKAPRQRFLEVVHERVSVDDEDAVLLFLANRKKSAEIVESVAKYLEWKVDEAGEKSPHIRNLERHLNPMAKNFAGKKVIDVTSDELKKFWVKKWGHLSWKTRRDTRASFVGFWKWCIFQSLYPKDVTPAECIPSVKAEKLEKRVLTPDEFLSLAKEIQPQYRAAVILQAFCGMRPEETAPPTKKGAKKKGKRGIRAEEIDWCDNCIRIPAEVSKTSSPRITPLLPAAGEWLEWAGVKPGSKGPICNSNLAEDKETIRLGKKVFKTGWPKDALRHSYASYRNAIIRSFPQVAEEMGTSESMLKRHYHNPRSKQEGEAWWAMRPP